jgi:hypothetical protein
MELRKLLTPFSNTTSNIMDDQTLYQITTHTNHYCGRIAHQNEVMIKLQSKEGKPVKILKGNIKSIATAAYFIENTENSNKNQTQNH